MPCPDITVIDKTECIGNSLITINGNFKSLRNAVCEIDTGIAVLQEGVQVGQKIGIVNFTGSGVSVNSANSVASINIPGFQPGNKVSRLEEQGTNSGGGKNNFFILNDGSLRVCGANSKGELGIGTERASFVPRVAAFMPPIEPDEGISKVYTQGNVTYCVTTKGRVYGAGDNSSQQMGGAYKEPGENNTIFRFINVLGDELVPISSTNPVLGYSFATTDPVVELATGTTNSSSGITIYARTQSGKIYAWGNNKYGQAAIGGDGTSAQEFRGSLLKPQRAASFIGSAKQIASAGSKTLTTVYIVDSEGRLFVAGNNTNGQAGVGGVSSQANEGPHLTVFTEVPLPDPGTRIKKVVVGGGSTRGTVTCWAIATNGALYACGWNDKSSQVLGSGAVPNNLTRVIPNLIRVNQFTNDDFVEDVVVHTDSNATTCWALIRDGNAYRLKGWGNNRSGQLGLPNIIPNHIVASSTTWPWIQSGAKVKQVAVAGDGDAKATLVLDTNNILWTAGTQRNGLLGNGVRSGTRAVFRQVPFNPGLGTPILIRSTNNDSGFANFLVLLSTGKVLAWGYDGPKDGQLGVDPFPEITTVPSLVQILM